MKNNNFTCGCDLDGVLCNFNKQVQKATGKLPSQLTKKELWEAVQKYNDTVAPFFETMEKMPDADVLLTFLFKNFEKIEVLTASGSTPKDCPQQKVNWVKKNIGDIPVKVVREGKLKAMYANPATILIDDRLEVIEAFEKAGGIGILHKNAMNTIYRLKLILEQD